MFNQDPQEIGNKTFIFHTRYSKVRFPSRYLLSTKTLKLQPKYLLMKEINDHLIVGKLVKAESVIILNIDQSNQWKRAQQSN